MAIRVSLSRHALLRSLLTFAAAAALGAATASAQTSTGGLRGFVKDDTGAVLAGVTVEASSPLRIGGEIGRAHV